MTLPDDPLQPQELIRKRQRGRAMVLAILLGALVILIFAITLAKIRMGMA